MGAGVLDGERLLGFPKVHHLVLGAVVLEDAVDVLHPGDEQNVAQEENDPDDAVHEVEEQPVRVHRRVGGLRRVDPRGDQGTQPVGHQHKQGDAGRQRKHQRPDEHPVAAAAGAVLPLSPFPAVLDRLGHGHLGREVERLDPDDQRLQQDGRTADQGPFQEPRPVGPFGRRLALDHDLPVGAADRDGDGVGRPHHDPLQHRLAAHQDIRLQLASAFRHGPALRGKQKGLPSTTARATLWVSEEFGYCSLLSVLPFLV